MILNLLERLGWIVRCAKCKRVLPYGKPPAWCHMCYYGYVRDGKWTPKDAA